jgi:flagellar biosynthesis protein FlhF
LAGVSDRAGAPTIITLVGPTGVGKTTTIAKLAARVALREKRRVELVTLDTYRIAAVEQLRTYAEIIGAGFHVARSMVELDAITRRLEATATVLVDTVGRNPHDLADQLEFGDYLRAREDMVKCLVLQATTHPADALAAIRKFALYGADRLVITKLDETTAPGRVVALANESKLPLLYLCAGQRVPEDMERATPDALAARVVRAGHVANSV